MTGFFKRSDAQQTQKVLDTTADGLEKTFDKMIDDQSLWITDPTSGQRSQIEEASKAAQVALSAREAELDKRTTEGARSAQRFWIGFTVPIALGVGAIILGVLALSDPSPNITDHQPGAISSDANDSPPMPPPSKRTVRGS